jgi:hypothetical protein
MHLGEFTIWLILNILSQLFESLSLCGNQYQNTSKSCKSTICRIFFFPRYAKMFKKSQYVGEQLKEEKSAHQIARNDLFMNMFTT